MRDMADGDTEAYQKLLEGIITEMTGETDSSKDKEHNNQASANKKIVGMVRESLTICRCELGHPYCSTEREVYCHSLSL